MKHSIQIWEQAQCIFICRCQSLSNHMGGPHVIYLCPHPTCVDQCVITTAADSPIMYPAPEISLQDLPR